MKRFKFIVFSMVILIVSFTCINAQQESSNKKLLDLKNAELTLKHIRSSYEIALELKKSGLISDLEFSKKSTEYLKAKVEYQRALLDFTGTEARVLIQSATKRIDKKGRPHAKITLLYSARNIEALYSLGIKEDLFPLDFLKELQDIYVSLYADDYIISEPYQVKIDKIALGKTKVVDFILLKDVESLEISVYYIGKTDKTKAYLLKDSSTNVITLNSSQFSQEVNLGGEALFDLSLERYTRESSVFRLHVKGLPKDVSYEFIDPDSNARLSQIKFQEGTTSMKLQLKVYLPRELPVGMVIDKPIHFYALCLDEQESKYFNRDMDIKNYKKILNDLKGGSVELEIIPIGIGKLDLNLLNMYREIRVDEFVKMKIFAKNSGTRSLNNINIIIDVPLEWKSEIEPGFIRQLDKNGEKEVNLKIIPPINVSVGDYEVKIKADAISGGKKVDSDEKNLRIHVASKPNIIGTILLIVFLAVLITAIVVFGLKLTKR